MTKTLDVGIRTTPTRFRYEAEMIPILRDALARLTFGRSVASAVEVFTEVPAMHGIPDVAAVRFDLDIVARRRAASVRPLSSDVEVRAALALREGPLATKELASRLQMSTDYVRRAIVPMLVDLNWVQADGGVLTRNPEAAFAGRRVVTVEAKLRDWRGAIGQARRQQLSADAAYIALDAPSLRAIDGDLDQLAAGGIGVIAVDASLRVARVLVRPKARPSGRSAVGRMLVAERCLEMLDRGTREGQIYPVFGWTMPATL
jgi:hypothetical protein